MRGRHTALVAFVLLAGVASHTQRLNPSPREVFTLPRNLFEAEVSAVLDASRHALDGRTFRISYQPDGPGPDVLMGPDGRPRYIRATSGNSGQADVVTFLHYTRTPARMCGGTSEPGELVLEYENAGRGWSVKSRSRRASEINGAAFDMLAGAHPVTAGPAQRIGDRPARPLIAPYKLPEGAIGGPPPGTMMSLWLDTDTLLPVRWSLTIPASRELGIPAGLPEFGVVFTYREGIDLHPPTEVPAPDCIR